MVAALAPSFATAQSIEVREAWIRGTVAAQQATGAFMQIMSKAPARLVAVASPAAKAAEIHDMKVDKGVMRMFAVEAVEVPAGATVKLAPGGHHVMLLQLVKPLNAGDKVPLALTFELADRRRVTVEVLAEVRDLKGEPAKHHHH
jgi:copper(I)-binding protein